VKPVLKTAVVALILEYVLSFVLFLVCLVPAYLIGTMLPDSVSGWAWIVAILLALNIRAAFLHPIFLTMVALTFHKNVQGQEIDQSMADKLSSVSDKFQELTRRAKEWVEEKMGSKGEAPVESPAG
jgi:di/tricarboxylate transporter